MNLIQNDKVELPAFLTGRKKWYFLFGFISLFLIVSTVWEHTGAGRPQRKTEYIDGMKLSADRGDSAEILNMYQKLNAVYDIINSTDCISLSEFSDVNKAKLPPGFHTKLITYDLLDFMFDTAMKDVRKGMAYESMYGYDSFFEIVNASMGNGNFLVDFSDRKFHKGFASDARYITDEKYVMVLVIYELTSPNSNENANEFESGICTGGILVFDLAELRMVGYETFSTSNSSEVNTGPYVKEEIDRQLMKNLEANVNTRVNEGSQKIFGKPVWPENS